MSSASSQYGTASRKADHAACALREVYRGCFQCGRVFYTGVETVASALDKCTAIGDWAPQIAKCVLIENAMKADEIGAPRRVMLAPRVDNDHRVLRETTTDKRVWFHRYRRQNNVTPSVLSEQQRAEEEDDASILEDDGDDDDDPIKGNSKKRLVKYAVEYRRTAALEWKAKYEYEYQNHIHQQNISKTHSTDRTSTEKSGIGQQTNAAAVLLVAPSSLHKSKKVKSDFVGSTGSFLGMAYPDKNNTARSPSPSRHPLSYYIPSPVRNAERENAEGSKTTRESSASEDPVEWNPLYIQCGLNPDVVSGALDMITTVTVSEVSDGFGGGEKCFVDWSVRFTCPRVRPFIERCYKFLEDEWARGLFNALEEHTLNIAFPVSLNTSGSKSGISTTEQDRIHLRFKRHEDTYVELAANKNLSPSLVERVHELLNISYTLAKEAAQANRVADHLKAELTGQNLIVNEDARVIADLRRRIGMLEHELLLARHGVETQNHHEELAAAKGTMSPARFHQKCTELIRGSTEEVQTSTDSGKRDFITADEVEAQKQRHSDTLEKHTVTRVNNYFNHQTQSHDYNNEYNQYYGNVKDSARRCAAPSAAPKESTVVMYREMRAGAPSPEYTQSSYNNYNNYKITGTSNTATTFQPAPPPRRVTQAQ